MAYDMDTVNMVTHRTVVRHLCTYQLIERERGVSCVTQVGLAAVSHQRARGEERSTKLLYSEFNAVMSGGRAREQRETRYVLGPRGRNAGRRSG